MDAAASGFALSRTLLRMNACNFPYNFGECCKILDERRMHHAHFPSDFHNVDTRTPGFSPTIHHNTIPYQSST